ncbi:hypothetical protein D3C79_856520 [compost metagenome]
MLPGPTMRLDRSSLLAFWLFQLWLPALVLPKLILPSAMSLATAPAICICWETRLDTPIPSPPIRPVKAAAIQGTLSIIDAAVMARFSETTLWPIILIMEIDAPADWNSAAPLLYIMLFKMAYIIPQDDNQKNPAT